MNGRFSRQRFDELPLIGILRGFDLEQIPALLESALAGGLTNLEITMNTPAAAKQIEAAVKTARGRMNIGAGTVTTPTLLDEALSAGASFVVTPHVQSEVITRCREQRIPVFAGALSATEIHRAWELGSTLVKVFPADLGGPCYIKTLIATFPHIGLVPTGGVNLESLPEYLEAGGDAFGLGSPLFNRTHIQAGDWPWLKQQCRRFADLYRRLRTPAHQSTTDPSESR